MLNLDWFAGFADGEGSFIMAINKYKDKTVTFSPQFRIALVKSDRDTLLAIQKLLADYGIECGINTTKVHKSWSQNAKPQCRLLIGSRKQCLQLYKFLKDRVYLKKAELVLWAQIIKDLQQKKHFAYEGFLEVMSQIDRLHSMRNSHGLRKYSLGYFLQNPPSQFTKSHKV